MNFWEEEPEPECERCNTGLGLHACWRREVAGRTEKVNTEPLRRHERHEAVDQFQYGKKASR
jgi:hypothetical protein